MANIQYLGASDTIAYTGRNGKVGIGTSVPDSKLEVAGGDIEVDNYANGLVLKDSGGTRWRVQVNTSGALVVSLV